MCIVFFIFGHPKYKLILASNRDESLKRPTQTADFWNIDENIISAIDLATVTHINKPNKDLNNKKSTKLKRCSHPSTINSYEKQLLDEILKKDILSSHSSLSESINKENEEVEKYNSINNIYKTEKKISGYGTWLGCTRQGLFSTLTNFREDPKALKPDAISRGYLVRDFLLLKSLYNKSKNITNQNSHRFSDGKGKNTTTNSTYQRIRMHHPRNQAPEKVLKRYNEEDKLYAMEDSSNASENMDQETVVNMDLNNDQIDFPYEYMKYVNKNKDKYNGFNLIVGDVSLPEPSVWYIGNTDNSSTEKLNKNTVYGMSNGSLNTYWKKIERGKKLFARAVESHTDLNDLVHKLLNVLSDKKDVPLDKLPKTAFEPKLEKCCAPICIEKERFNGTIFENDYATRTHTVIVIDNENRVTFVEQDQYDTISNNYIMKQQCYVFPPIDNPTNMNMNIPQYIDESISTPIHQLPLSNYNRGMTMPINIPRHRHNSIGSSNGNSFHRAYTTSFASDNPYYFSPTKGRHSFDSLYLGYNTIPNTPMSLSSIESITGNTLTALSISNSSSRNNNYLFNNSINSSINTSFPTLVSDIHYNSNHMINNEKDSEFDDDYKNYDNNDDATENENEYLEDQMEKMSIESSSPSKSPEVTIQKQMEKVPSLSSCTPITPSVFNFFESITSNDYKDKPIESQYVKRNVHDLSKANIHQFKLL